MWCSKVAVSALRPLPTLNATFPPAPHYCQNVARHISTESDFSGSCVTGYDSSSFRCGPTVSNRGPNPRPPGSRTRNVHTCQGLRPRRTGWVLALTRPPVLPSVITTTSASGLFLAFAAQWLAYALPYRRFAVTLASADARLGADADRYSFTVVDLHHLFLAGFAGAPKVKNFVPPTNIPGGTTMRPEYSVLS